MSDPYASDGSSDPISGHASGVLTTGTLLYTSSIDSAITGLVLKYAYDNGCALAGGTGSLPIMILVHGYSGDADSLTADDLARWAARGFVCATVGMRGRNSALGVRDNHCREEQDILDAVTTLRSTITYASATRASITGYSDGGGAALMASMRSDVFTVRTGFFPLVDYGDTAYDPTATYGWWTFAAVSSDSHTLLTADIGGSPTDLPAEYATRNVVRSIAFAQQNLAASSPDGWTYILHDSADVLVSVAGSDAISAMGLSNLSYTRTTGVSAHRALHGHPSDHPSDLPPLEWIFALSAHDRPALVLPAAGSLVILGSYVSVTRDFEVWLDDPDSTGSTRTNGTGGIDRIAQCAYDVDAGTLTLTPMLGSMRAYVRIGDVEITAFLSPNAITIFNAATGTVSQVEADLANAPTTWAAGAPASWADSAATEYPAAPVDWLPGDWRSHEVIAS